MSKEAPKNVRDIVRDRLAALLQVPTGHAHEQVDQLTDDEVARVHAIFEVPGQMHQRLRDVKDVLTDAYERRRIAAQKQVRAKAKDLAVRQGAVEVLKDHARLTHAQALAAIHGAEQHNAQALVTAAAQSDELRESSGTADNSQESPAESNAGETVDPNAAAGEARGEPIHTGDVTTAATG